ncbi:MAG: hypothetical protein WC091_14575 [Sulfuricellaceae bacterium]
MKQLNAIDINIVGISKHGNTKLNISINISNPYWVIEGEEAACDVKISPLYENLSPISGLTLFQALTLALEFSNVLLNDISK